MKVLDQFDTAPRKSNVSWVVSSCDFEFLQPLKLAAWPLPEDLRDPFDDLDPD